MNSIELQVNGRAYSFNLDPATPLIYVLRNELGLKAAKLACGLEQCGACKVLVDGEALPSCRQPVTAFVGKAITTVEGIADGNELHPVQQAFLSQQAAQCGYCTAGFITATVSLLSRHPSPTDEQIDEALERHLCRCGTYHRIRRAVHQAAQANRP